MIGEDIVKILDGKIYFFSVRNRSVFISLELQKAVAGTENLYDIMPIYGIVDTSIEEENSTVIWYDDKDVVDELNRVFKYG